MSHFLTEFYQYKKQTRKLVEQQVINYQLTDFLLAIQEINMDKTSYLLTDAQLTI